MIFDPWRNVPQRGHQIIIKRLDTSVTLMDTLSISVKFY